MFVNNKCKTLKLISVFINPFQLKNIDIFAFLYSYYEKFNYK